MSLCTCAAKSSPRPVLLEIGDYSRIVSVTCPNCGEYVLDSLDPAQMDQLYASELIATMTTEVDQEGVYATSYRLSSPPAELLESAG